MPPQVGLVGENRGRVPSIQTELWVGRPAFAIPCYERAFGAAELHRVGEGDDIVAQLARSALQRHFGAADSPVCDPALLVRRFHAARVEKCVRDHAQGDARGQQPIGLT